MLYIYKQLRSFNENLYHFNKIISPTIKSNFGTSKYLNSYLKGLNLAYSCISVDLETLCLFKEFNANSEVLSIPKSLVLINENIKKYSNSFISGDALQKQITNILQEISEKNKNSDSEYALVLFSLQSKIYEDIKTISQIIDDKNKNNFK